MMSAAGSPQFSATTQVKTNYHQIIIKETMDLAEKLEEFVKSSLLKLVESKQFLLDFKKLYSNSYAKVLFTFNFIAIFTKIKTLLIGVQS